MSDNGLVNGVFSINNTTTKRPSSVMSMFSLKGKTALVTGAGSGIGLDVARALAEAGANVIIWYNSNKIALEKAAEIEKQYGVMCRAYQVDVTNADAVEKAMNENVAEFNCRLDVVVANSGIPWTQGPMITGDLAHYRKVMATDVDGVYYCARSAGKIWRRQKLDGVDCKGKPISNFTYGSFVATASMSGHIVNIPQLQASYNAAKAAVRHLCTSLAVEWVKFARANTVSPGYMATEISGFISPDVKNIWRTKIPMGREGETHELQAAYLYLASDASSYTTGTDIIVDGGYHCP